MLISRSNRLIHLDSVLLIDGNRITGENDTKRPDIWYETDDLYYLIEVTVPYGDVSEENELSLEVRYNEKKEKYAELLVDIKNQSGKDAKLIVIVISSLGAWYSESLKELRIIAETKENFKRFAKRMVIATLKYSRKILMNIFSEENRRNNSSEEDRSASSTPSTSSSEKYEEYEETEEYLVNPNEQAEMEDIQDLPVESTTDTEDATTGQEMSCSTSSSSGGEDDDENNDNTLTQTPTF
ncbi:hypothetical protein GPJ56_005003 [Histomonas meleagridis]|uniref:uncharacterized protein n=1 Tax=Histomonas meleagridis TaxID=135588 RepID=UPI00355A12AE|nr:hypothetical protein GPJ56_005003 [Histomonas meleagridis]KAH0805905.1 hypothetical protein GO595_001293 [Histomonas meleagridis]